ncbi:hypothetical protein Q2941_11035 [Bradyrhizobium sp. UFLA05-153]
MSEAVSLHFEVLSGLYSGLTGLSAVGTSLIGSGLDADMIFVEQGLDPQHFRINLVGNSIEIEAIAAGCDIEGHGNIAAGQRVVVSLPAVIHAGAMSMRWSAQDAAPVRAIDTPRVSIPALAVLLVGILGTVTASTIFFNNAGAPSAPSGAAVEPLPKLTINRPDDRTIHAAAEVLQEEVDRAGLLNIQIGSGLGVVTAEGTVTPAMVASWQKAQQWFDRRTNGALTLVNGVAVKEEKAPSSIAVEAVWRGAQPYLLIKGQKYFVGALLNDGWTLSRIEERRLLLSRNGRSAAIPY